MPKDDFLAVAFTDVNGNDKYNPGKDTLIAALVDTNNDNVVSVGDAVIWGTYPAIPDGSASGTGGIYTSLNTTVTNVGFVTSYGLQVETTSGTIFWYASPNVEQFLTFNSLFEVESNLIDSINYPLVEDSIFADSTIFGPGQPNFSVEESTFQLGDQAFLDVYNGWWI